jgi:hypothetical protein
MWVVDAPNAVATSSDENAEPPVDEINSDYAMLSGAGVTESDYTSYNSYQSEAKLISPLGTAASYAGAWGSYSRADVSLNISLTNTEAGDYVLETAHTESSYGTGGTEIAPVVYSHSSKTKYRGPSTSVATPKPLFFRWITRLIAGVRPFKVVYKYFNQLQVGTEIRYYYYLHCQRPDCKAAVSTSYPSTKFGGFHPPWVIIRGVKVTINLLFTRIHSCVGKSSAAFYQDNCV